MSTEIINVEKEDLKNEENLAQCECGNWTHSRYITTGADDHYSCPECQTDWLETLVGMYKKLLVELADPSFPKDGIVTRIKQEVCKYYCVEDFEDLGFDDDYFDFILKPKP